MNLGEDLNNACFNYSPTPESDLQSKIDYLMSPYNNSIMYEKHMSFNQYSNSETKNKPDEMSNKSGWNQMKNLLFHKDVEFVKNNLIKVNQELIRLKNPVTTIDGLFPKKKKRVKKSRKPLWKPNAADSVVLTQFRSKPSHFEKIGRNLSIGAEYSKNQQMLSENSIRLKMNNSNIL